MRIFLLLVSVFCICSIPASAQLEANNWYWGNGMGVQFLPQLKQLDSNYVNWEEVISFSDRNTGQFLFCSSENHENKYDGREKIKYQLDLFNRNYERFNSEPLRSDVSCSQGLLIVPHPINCKQYYLLSLDSRFRTGVTGDDKYQTQLTYSIIDMSDGKGQVVSKDNRIIEDYFTEGMTGTIHRNGTDFWVVLRRYSPPSFVSIPITQLGINANNVVNSFPESLSPYTPGSIGVNMMKISPNGKLLL